MPIAISLNIFFSFNSLTLHLQRFQTLFQCSDIRAAVKCSIHQQRIDLIKRYFHVLKSLAEEIHSGTVFKKDLSKGPRETVVC